jgi:thiosulfate/3-mercaptopyruvate sulfurtransferase
MFLLFDRETDVRNRNCFRTLIALITAFFFITSLAGAAEQSETIDSLVSVDWLNRHIDDPDLVVIDCSVITRQREDGSLHSVSGRSDFDKGHIPTAGFADLMGELADQDSPLQFAVPAPEQFVATMAALGVGDDTRVVLYDSYNSAWAARVWWMLRWVGFDNAAILDGGVNAWTAAGHPLSSEPGNEPGRKLTLALRPELIADRDEVFASIGRDDVKLIDALPEPHFRGEIEFYGRPGHIPGAANLSVMSLNDDSGLFRPADELAGLVEGDPNTRTINYCGGGIAASATAFTLIRLGYTDVAVYTASLQEWAADPANPMEVAADLENTDE